jgi:chemotaxis methyl-accepting protein methylase
MVPCLLPFPIRGFPPPSRSREALFNTILINATGFFRDPDVWTYLDSAVFLVERNAGWRKI